MVRGSLHSIAAAAAGLATSDYVFSTAVPFFYNQISAVEGQTVSVQQGGEAGGCRGEAGHTDRGAH